MPTKRYSTEQIEVELSRGLRVPLVCKKLGIKCADVQGHRWWRLSRFSDIIANIASTHT